MPSWSTDTPAQDELRSAPEPARRDPAERARLFLEALLSGRGHPFRARRAPDRADDARDELPPGPAR